MKTIPFDLEKALAGAKVVTRDGRIITGLHLFQNVADRYPLYGVIDGKIHGWTPSGRFAGDSDFIADLFLAVEPKLRPWKDGEAPVGAQIRKRNDPTEGVRLILYSGPGVMSPQYGSQVPEEDLLRDWEWAWPNTNDWKPCGVEE